MTLPPDVSCPAAPPPPPLPPSFAGGGGFGGLVSIRCCCFSFRSRIRADKKTQLNEMPDHKHIAPTLNQSD